MRFSKLQFDNTDIEHVKQTTILRDFAWSCQNASDYVSQFSSNMIMWTGRVCLCFFNIIILFIDKVVCCLCSNKRDCQMSRTTITRLSIKVGGRYVVYDTAPIGTTNFAHNVSAISFLHSLPTVPRLWFFFMKNTGFTFLPVWLMSATISSAANDPPWTTYITTLSVSWHTLLHLIGCLTLW